MIKFLVRQGTKVEVGVFGRIKALLFLILDLSAKPKASVSWFCSLMRLAGRLMQGFCWELDFRAITKDRNPNKILSNQLADQLGMKILEL